MITDFPYSSLKKKSINKQWQTNLKLAKISSNLNYPRKQTLKKTNWFFDLCNLNYEIMKMNLFKQMKIKIYLNIYSLTSSYNLHMHITTYRKYCKIFHRWKSHSPAARLAKNHSGVDPRLPPTIWGKLTKKPLLNNLGATVVHFSRVKLRLMQTTLVHAFAPLGWTTVLHCCLFSWVAEFLKSLEKQSRL